jgi:hypothetical protein
LTASGPASARMARPNGGHLLPVSIPVPNASSIAALKTDVDVFTGPVLGAKAVADARHNDRAAKIFMVDVILWGDV